MSSSVSRRRSRCLLPSGVPNSDAQVGYAEKDMIMKPFSRLTCTLGVISALASPAAAQQTEPAAYNPDPAAVAAAPAADELSAAEAWKKGRPITMQYYRALDKRGLNVFESTKAPGAEYTGFKLDFGAAFTAQVQDLSHRNA